MSEGIGFGTGHLPHPLLAQLSRVDLNLLVAFEALMSERSVTGAAARLRVGQPAMSSTLSRLRKLLKDPILVRQGRVMIATPLANALSKPVSDSLAELQVTLSALGTFDPEVDEHSFSVIASDFAAAALLHPLLVEISSTYPRIRLEVRTVSYDIPDELLRGRADVIVLPRESISSFPALWRDNVRREVLYRDRYVLAADAANSAVRPAMTVDEFSAMPYLAATFGDGSRPSLGDTNLDVLGIPRRVEITASATVAPFMLRNSTLVTLLPRTLATRVAKAANLQLIDPPMQLEPVTETLIWLRRLDGDPAQSWFRGRLRAQAAKLVATPSR
ncbi:nodulation protein D 1 [Rhodococcus sp. NKCM2511]|uniref:LysR family transcriptional regulator n=1 Tax=Rhodococcus sp. NKCM2511 TaxID=2766011 RepID=UPI0019105AE9|nr:LysR family transcriptional regulator [Rhodococcus sp. NKCM2511]GHP19075.1 nodulation protein D 1 [Rhodococcus sp. NKCM2511]